MQYRTIIVPLKTNKENFDYLMNCNLESAKVWNMILEIEGKFRKDNDGKWIDRNTLQTLTKGIAHLHAKGIQHIIQKYLHARDGALKAKEGNGTRNSYPHRMKRYFSTGWDSQSIKVCKNKITLAKPNITKDGKNVRQKPIVCYVKNTPENIAQVELIYRNGLHLAIKYKENSTSLQIESDVHAAIDLGEIHAITSIESHGNAVIITGRELRTIKQHRNKHQSDIYRRMSKCKLYSRQYKKYMNALKNLKSKYDRKTNDSLHKISKKYIDYCVENNVSIVFYGDLDSTSRNTKKKGRGNNFTRQKMTQWSFGKLITLLEYKLKRFNITMVKVPEFYTSQKCPCCTKLNKPKGRVYICRKCQYEQHRDIVGAVNILNENSGSNLVKYTSKKYLRIDIKSKVVNVDGSNL